MTEPREEKVEICTAHGLPNCCKKFPEKNERPVLPKKEGECEYCGWPKSERNKWCLPCRNRKVEKEGEGWDWEAEFDRRMTKESFLAGDSLYEEFTYPESEYELDPEKVKHFIRANFLSRTAVENMIEGMEINLDFKPVTDKYEGAEERKYGYNQALRDLKEKIKRE